jgi:hypothetical protein
MFTVQLSLPGCGKMSFAVKGVNEVSGEHIPLLEKEGWMRGPKISRSHLSPRRRGGQFGEAFRPNDFAELTTIYASRYRACASRPSVAIR